MMNRVFSWVLITALTCGTVQDAVACAFHGYTPNPTLVDRLLATDRVLIGRIDPNNPKKYISIDALSGPDVSEPSIETGSGNGLAPATPKGSAVLIVRDGAYGPWMELAVLDDRFQRLVGDILDRKSAWQLGHDKDRLSFFAARLNDPSPDIRRLALQELDRADYRSLQKTRLPVVQNLQQDLSTGDADLMPIRILLAGLSRDPAYGAVLSSKLGSAVQDDLPYLGAFAMAMIEHGQKDAVQTIFDSYLTDSTLPTPTKERLLEPLAMQYKIIKGPTRRFIIREVATLLRSSPDLKEAAARHFGLAILSDKQTSGVRLNSGRSSASTSGKASAQGDR